MKFTMRTTLFALIFACAADESQKDYDDFVSRSAAFRQDECTESTVVSADVSGDLSGQWLIRSRLGAGLTLGLRLAFERQDPMTQEYEVKFWLHDQPTDAPALVTTETEVDENGEFRMVADPLDLGKDVVQSESAVLATVILNAQVIDGNQWCGGVEGEVTSPLNLDLDGSTFFSQRLSDGLTLDDLPSSCPLSPCSDGGVIEETIDQGVTMDAPQKPDAPDLSDKMSTRSELTGHWILNAQLAGLPLSLWLSFYDHQPNSAGVIDGSVRLTRDELDSPPRIQFSTQVDADGRFEIWFGDLDLEITPLTIRGNLLLSAITQAPHFCGGGAGNIREPFEIDLTGTTFYAAPWTPGSAVPEDLPVTCPVETDGAMNP